MYNDVMAVFGFQVDFWTIWGMFAQVLFFFSFVFQWAVSEKQKKSVIPMGFWIIRILATILLIIYVFVRRDLVFLVSSVLQIGIYLRNIMLIKNENKK